MIGKMDCGGAETLLMNIYRSIDRSQIQFDFVVHSNTAGFYDNEIKRLGGSIYYAPPFLGTNIVEYCRFWNHFLSDHREYSIIHGHIGSSAMFYLNEARKQGRVAVAHSHNTRSNEISVKSMAYSFFSFPVRLVADYFFACSKQAGIDRFGKRIVKKEHFAVLFNGIDASRYRYDERTRYRIRHCMGVNDDTVVIGHVGRFSTQKNHVFLVNVFNAYINTHPNSELWLIGTGDQEQKVQQLVLQLGLKEKVRFLGVTDQVHNYLQGMDVFLFPSSFEGLGISLIEAQTASLPCVVSEAIVPEADIHAGLIHQLQLSDPIEKWVAKIEQCTKYQRQDTVSYTMEAGYDIQHTAEAICSFYNKVTDKNE